jgi:hypothetical protein
MMMRERMTPRISTDTTMKAMTRAAATLDGWTALDSTGF